MLLINKGAKWGVIKWPCTISSLVEDLLYYEVEKTEILIGLVLFFYNIIISILKTYCFVALMWLLYNTENML